MGDIAEWGYMYAKKVCKDFETKYIDDYQDLYLKSDTLLSDDAEMCSETLSISFTSWISMESSLKNTNSKLDLLTDIDMLLMVEQGIRGGICHAIHRCGIANSK